MSQDLISDALNGIMNAKKAGKTQLTIKRTSKLLVKVLEIMKQFNYIEYESENSRITVIIKELNECRAVKPRYAVANGSIEKYVRRFLPARNFGYVIISTSKGLMTHQDAQENKIGGSIIAYFY